MEQSKEWGGGNLGGGSCESIEHSIWGSGSLALRKISELEIIF